MLAALLLCCLLSINVQADTSELKIGAFNVQVFGKSKFGKAEVVETLTKIVSRYDVILIQEIRDSSMTVIFDFVKTVNKMYNSTEPSLMFDIKISERLGRTSSKEQYAFLYRAEKVQVIDTHQYNDTLDLFEREPYSILLAPAKGGTDFPPFFLVGIHIKPSDTVQELNALVAVYDELVDEFETTNGVILGDMNADCRYLSQKNFKKLDLVTDTRFTWLIDSTVDTTTSATDCSYDRVIVAGDILELIAGESTGIFQFGEEYGLTEDEAKAVSDHYPVEFSIDGRISSKESLKVCAFNVQVFGKLKFRQSTVVYTLSKIVRHCGVIFVQGIRDSSKTVIHEFLDTVNRDSFPEGIKYSLSVSEQLGRANSKEQYAFIYRTDKVKVLAEYQYTDSADKFRREPFSVLLSSLQNDLPPFFLVGIHAQPSDVFEEMNALVNVYDEMVELFNTSSGIILGDMNADCNYLSQTKYKQLDLVTDPRFSWLIDSTVDTTTSASDCSYDRIIVAGEIRCYVVGESAGVIRFDEAYALSPKETKAVSEHYPIKLHLQQPVCGHCFDVLSQAATGGSALG